MSAPTHRANDAPGLDTRTEVTARMPKTIPTKKLNGLPPGSGAQPGKNFPMRTEDDDFYEHVQRDACRLLGKIFGDHKRRLAVIDLMRQITEDMEARRPEPKEPMAPVLAFTKPVGAG